MQLSKSSIMYEEYANLVIAEIAFKTLIRFQRFPETLLI